jgi:hypothetical protein
MDRVTDLLGAQIVSPARQAAIERALIQLLATVPEGAAARAGSADIGRVVRFRRLSRRSSAVSAFPYRRGGCGRQPQQVWHIVIKRSVISHLTGKLLIPKERV